MSTAERDHWVYRVYDEANRLLYIGCSRNLSRRLMDHRASRAKWVLFKRHFVLRGPYTYADGRRVERELINELGPYFNETSAQIGARTSANFKGEPIPGYQEACWQRYLAVAGVRL